MATKTRFEFGTKRDRNRFLQVNGLCIAGTLARHPNICDGSGRSVSQ